MTDPQQQPKSARTITCPSCGGTIGIKAVGYTVSVACLYCGTVLDVAHEDVRIIAEYHQAVAQLDIPLGTRGSLFGVEWEAVGWLERSGAGATWQEYLLFNPYAGYRWLVLSDGDWQFGTMLTDRPEMVADEVARWRGNSYELDDEPYQIGTRRVLGEFYWRVRAGDVVDAASFSRGREQLSCEWTADETQWTQMVPLSGRQLRDAFTPSGAPSDKPRDGGQRGWWARFTDLPFASDEDLAPIFGLAFTATLAVLLVMALLSGDRQGIAGSMDVPVDGGAAHGEYGPVAITRASQMMTLNLQGQGFTNKWIDVQLSLVDRKTQQAIHANATLEHYSGADSDGNWSQGDGSATVRLADVPRGSYNLLIEAQAHSWHDGNAAPLPEPTPTTDASNPWGLALKPPPEQVTMAFAAEDGGMDWPLFATFAVLILGMPCIIVIWRLSRGGR